MIHIPVLQKEVLKYLDPKPNENFIDCTVGFGGHAKAILKKIEPEGKVLGIERDKEIFEELSSLRMERLVLVNDSYVNLKKIVEKYQIEPIHPVKCRKAASSPCEQGGIFNRVNGILFDLGMSSWHLEESGRGFSFLKDEPLDMRYCLEFIPRSWQKFQELTAEKIINQWPESEIRKILREYGEERYAGRLSRKIIEARKIKPIKTTFQLVEIIKKVVPQKTKINPATRTFQALRIAVNEELSSFEKTLPRALDILAPGGKLAVISFHSLEDRIVKNFFKENKEKNLLELLVKKPIVPQKEEIKINPRCRSAKLRAAVKL